MDAVLTSLADVLAATDAAARSGAAAAYAPIETGFSPLDTYLGGGLRPGELTLLGGPQGLGKTTFALQLARNAAVAGLPVLYFCYEHDATTVLMRLVALEAGLREAGEMLTLRKVREAFDSSAIAERGLAGRLGGKAGERAVAAVASYADRLQIHRSSGKTTSVDAIRDVVQSYADGAGHPLVVIDYLQKVAVPDGAEREDERVTHVVEELKDLALDADVPIVAIVAADREGLATPGRLRAHHLRGSSALAYEADVILMLNDKYDVVARHHLVYDVANAERFRDYVVLTIEKNRSGLDAIDLEFRKRFDLARFDNEGAPVTEQLTDDRIFVD
jgi:replicative DNA helicase